MESLIGSSIVCSDSVCVVADYHCSEYPAGYPIRMQHTDFLARYRALVPGALKIPDIRAACAHIIGAFKDLDGSECQVGNTKVFMRNGA